MGGAHLRRGAEEFRARWRVAAETTPHRGQWRRRAGSRRFLILRDLILARRFSRNFRTLPAMDINQLP